MPLQKALGCKIICLHKFQADSAPVWSNTTYIHKWNGCGCVSCANRSAASHNCVRLIPCQASHFADSCRCWPTVDVLLPLHTSHAFMQSCEAFQGRMRSVIMFTMRVIMADNIAISSSIWTLCTIALVLAPSHCFSFDMLTCIQLDAGVWLRVLSIDVLLQVQKLLDARLRQFLPEGQRRSVLLIDSSKHGKDGGYALSRHITTASTLSFVFGAPFSPHFSWRPLARYTGWKCLQSPGQCR